MLCAQRIIIVRETEEKERTFCRQQRLKAAAVAPPPDSHLRMSARSPSAFPSHIGRWRPLCSASRNTAARSLHSTRCTDLRLQYQPTSIASENTRRSMQNVEYRLTRVKTPLCRLMCYICRMNVVRSTCAGQVIFFLNAVSSTSLIHREAGQHAWSPVTSLASDKSRSF